MINKFTIDDVVVKESLDAVNHYDKENPDNKFVVIGGIATQLYTDKYSHDLLRPTTDLDLATDKKTNFESYKNGIGGYLAHRLNKYGPHIASLRHVLEVKLTDDKPKFLIHTYKFTENGYKRNQRSLERQTSNALKLQIPDSTSKVYVARPEDLLDSKINRIKIIITKGKIPEEFKLLYENIERNIWSGFSKDNMEEWLNDLKQEKEELPSVYDHGFEEFTQALDHYRCSKDLYDVALLVSLALNGNISFDESYYRDIVDKKE